MTVEEIKAKMKRGLYARESDEIIRFLLAEFARKDEALRKIMGDTRCSSPLWNGTAWVDPCGFCHPCIAAAALAPGEPTKPECPICAKGDFYSVLDYFQHKGASCPLKDSLDVIHVPGEPKKATEKRCPNCGKAKCASGHVPERDGSWLCEPASEATDRCSCGKHDKDSGSFCPP